MAVTNEPYRQPQNPGSPNPFIPATRGLHKFSTPEEPTCPAPVGGDLYNINHYYPPGSNREIPGRGYKDNLIRSRSPTYDCDPITPYEHNIKRDDQTQIVDSFLEDFASGPQPGGVHSFQFPQGPGSPCSPLHQNSLFVTQEVMAPRYDCNKGDWFHHFRVFLKTARVNRWSEFYMADRLFSTLQGTAQKFALSLPFHVQNNFRLLLYSLAKHFEPEEKRQASISAFHARNRNNKESFADYGQALQDLVYKAFPGSDESSRQSSVVYRFISGLKPVGLREHVHFGKPKTLN